MALKETPICDFGALAADFTLPDLSGMKVSLQDVRGVSGTLIIFMCNHCPYVQAIIERLVRDVRDLRTAGIGIAAIMSNDYSTHPEDAPDRMRAFATEHGIDFPYLLDEDQSVARAYGAVCTPDFFGYNSDLELQYRGRIDDSPMDAGNVTRRDLLAAMRLIADTGAGPGEQVPSMGCSIKWRSG